MALSPQEGVVVELAPMDAALAASVSKLERVAGSAMITLRRARPHDWDVTVFRDAPSLRNVVFLRGYGATLHDAIRDLLGGC